MKNIKTVFAAFREMHRLEKRLIPTSVIVALVTAVMPFVNIWFTSKIIDLLESGAGMKSLALYIGLAVGINAVLFFINYYLGDIQFVYRSLMYNKELQRISSRLFGIEYQKLESSEFKELVHKHSEAQDRVFSSFVQLTWMMRDFISGALTLIISVVIVAPLFKIGFEKTGDTFFERPAFLLTIFGVIAVMAVIILIVAIRMNKAWFKASDEYSRLDRIFYYFLNMFSNYNTGKEIRIYKEQDLIEHTATDRLLTDGERILKKASMNTAKQSSFVAILGALVGFGIYLFIGVKGLYGLFGIGSLVLYCGAFMQIIGGIMKMAVTFGKTAEMVPLVNYYFEIVNTEDEMTYGDKVLDLSSGGIDSLFLSKYYHKPAYSLSGGIFNYTGEKEIIKKFVNDNKIAHKFVEIPRICSETILEYKNLLFLYALPNFNMEMFYKCILCNEIFREMGNCNFATGQGSDELFGGYSSNCKSYDEYSKKLQRLLFDMCEEKTGLYDSRKNFFSKNYLLTEFYGVFNNFRELELNYELTKLSNNALVTDNFCAKVNSLSNISPYINLDILNYMKNINGETLYDKSIFRKQVSKNLGFRYASIKKNPFIYNKYYYYSYNYIKELILYKNSFKSSLLDEALDSSVFNSGILDKKYFEDFSTIVLKNQIDNTQLELIEVVLKIINAALIYEKYLK